MKNDYYSKCIFTGSAAKNEFDSGKKIFVGISTRAELSSIVRLAGYHLLHLTGFSFKSKIIPEERL